MKSLTENWEKKENKFHHTKDRVTTEASPEKTGKKKKRRCLMCDKLFGSVGPHNRRCPECNRLVLSGKGRDFYHDTTYRFAFNEPVTFDLPDNTLN